MKQLFLILFSLPLLQQVAVAEDLWYLEVDMVINGEKQHAYIYYYPWGGESHRAIRDNDSLYMQNDSLFKQKFFEVYKDYDYLDIYTTMHHTPYYVENAPFRIDPFYFLETDKKRIDPKDITAISLNKLWYIKTIGLAIYTPLIAKDTTWLKQKSERLIAEPTTVGCSIQAYDFGNLPNTKKLVEQLIALWKKEEDTKEHDEAEWNKLVNLLYENKVVVTKYCGC